MTTLHDLGSVLGQPLDTSFGLTKFHSHGSCEVALRHLQPKEALNPSDAIVITRSLKGFSFKAPSYRKLPLHSKLADIVFFIINILW